MESRAALLDLCVRMVADRAGGGFEVKRSWVAALSDDTAYVVREGLYTIELKDGRRRTTPLVSTGIWTREGETWRRIHLHESIPIPRPPPPGADGSP